MIVFCDIFADTFNVFETLPERVKNLLLPFLLTLNFFSVRICTAVSQFLDTRFRPYWHFLRFILRVYDL